MKPFEYSKSNSERGALIKLKFRLAISSCKCFRNSFFFTPILKKILSVVVIASPSGGNLNKIIIESKKETKEIPVEGVFVQIGMIPEVDFAKKVVKMDKTGKIIINPRTCETSTKGIFAAGDVANNLYHQIIIAAAQGAIAALSAAKYLEKIGKVESEK